MSIEPPSKSTTTVHHSFSCGAEGEHQGGIIGCCYICGQLLCEAHTYYIPNSPLFANALGDGSKAPLACKSHAGEDYRRGLPRESLLESSPNQKISRRPKSKRPKPSGRRV